MRTHSRPIRRSIWDFPRPPAVEACPYHIQIRHGGELIADSVRALAVLEKGHPPSYYLHPADIRMELLEPADRTTFCEFKGIAHYFHLVMSGDTIDEVAWTYLTPSPGFETIKNHLAFYPGHLDVCLVDGERARPEPRHFYGGWITSHVRGPFR